MKRFLFKFSILLIIVGIALLIWLGVGQYIAQINHDGQYISWRVLNDVSLWGYIGIPCIFVGIVLNFYSQDER